MRFSIRKTGFLTPPPQRTLMGSTQSATNKTRKAMRDCGEEGTAKQKETLNIKWKIKHRQQRTNKQVNMPTDKPLLIYLTFPRTHPFHQPRVPPALLTISTMSSFCRASSQDSRAVKLKMALAWPMTVNRLLGPCRCISGPGAGCFVLKESTWLVSALLNAGVAAALGPRIWKKQHGVSTTKY